MHNTRSTSTNKRWGDTYMLGVISSSSSSLSSSAAAAPAAATAAASALAPPPASPAVGLDGEVNGPSEASMPPLSSGWLIWLPPWLPAAAAPAPASSLEGELPIAPSMGLPGWWCWEGVSGGVKSGPSAAVSPSSIQWGWQAEVGYDAYAMEP